MKKIDTIVFVAHDDDEALMAGGLISKRVFEGRNVLVVSCMRVSVFQDNVGKSNADKFGYNCIQLDNPVFGTKIHELASDIFNIIYESRPNTIVTHVDFDTHQDHLAVNKAVEIATRSINRNGNFYAVPNILYGFGVGAYENSNVFIKPIYLCPLSMEFAEIKIKMISSYHRETFGIRTPENAMLDMRWFGKLAGVEIAEGFLIKRMVEQ